MWSNKELTSLAGMCAPVKALATDENDEFGVVRENGKRQGIFKTWAVPVLPFLDSKQLGVLSSLWPYILNECLSTGMMQGLKNLQHNKSSAIQKKADEALLIMGSWNDSVASNPQRLLRSLERARINSWLIDRTLTSLFKKTPLSKSLPVKFWQLTARLELAFGLMNPFYHLEVLAGESQVLSQAQATASSSAGKLDGIALLLPYVLHPFVRTNHRSWNGLTWQHIHELTGQALSHPLFRKILLQTCGLAGTSPCNVVFAANALAFIKQKQGEENGFGPSSALVHQTLALLEHPQLNPKTTEEVLADINALIRFHNWLPLVPEAANFQGRSWCYASVCDTTQDLWALTIQNAPEIWNDRFCAVFQKELVPQLDRMDASSAKGRFLLSLLAEEEKLRSQMCQPLSYRKMRHALLLQALQGIAQGDASVHSPAGWFQQGLAGNKSFGLSLVHAIKPELVMPGFVLTTSQVESFLHSVPQLSAAILALDRAHDVPKKVALAKRIQILLMRRGLPLTMRRQIAESILRLPGGSFSIRSSSLEEGEARGVYSTFLQVRRSDCVSAVTKCIASFYSKKAVLFRMATGAGDLPAFAVLIQPYKRSIGGVAEFRKHNGDNGRLVNLSVGRTAAQVTSGSSSHYEWNHHQESHASANGCAEIVNLVEEIGDIFGPVQIEWLRDKHDFQILQMEFLPPEVARKHNKHGSKPKHVLQLQNLKDLPRIRERLKQSRGTFALSLKNINLETFQAELFGVIASFGKKVREIRLSKPISLSCHFANICRFFGIELVFP